MNNLYLALGVCGTALQLVVIFLMTKGFHRKYPGVFFYLLVLFLTGVADFAGFLDLDAYKTWYRSIYYINNTLRQFAGFLAVASLYFHATANHPRKVALRTRVLAVSFLIIGANYLFNYIGFESIPTFFANVDRNMSFLIAVLNMILWFALVKTRTGDTVLLLVCGGLGLNMAGDAIAQSLLSMPGDLSTQASLIGITSHILCLLIWIKALRLSQRIGEVTRAARTS